MSDLLPVIAAILAVGAFVRFRGALKLLSPSQSESFRQQRLFSGWHAAIFGVFFVGMLLGDDVGTAAACGVVVIACAAHEHRKNSRSMDQLDAPPEFKRRMGRVAWMGDAVVVLMVADSVLPHVARW